jgi:hypothetical protein
VSPRPQFSSCRLLTRYSYLQSLESRVHQLEDSLSTVKDDLNRLSSRVSQGGGSDTISSELDQHARQITPLRDLAGTEDSVDAMGTITLADEEDSGFFGIARATSVSVPLANSTRAFIKCRVYASLVQSHWELCNA